jgi:hypothetical protein
LDQLQVGDIKMVYPDISCCKSYTSKHNIAVYVGRKCGTTGYDQDSTVSTIFNNTVKELVISWFFGFRSFFKMFLAGRMSHIRVRLMIWSVQNTTYSFNGLQFLKADASLSHSFPSMHNSLIKLLNCVTNDKAFNAGDNTPAMQTDVPLVCPRI